MPSGALASSMRPYPGSQTHVKPPNVFAQVMCSPMHVVAHSSTSAHSSPSPSKPEGHAHVDACTVSGSTPAMPSLFFRAIWSTQALNAPERQHPPGCSSPESHTLAGSSWQEMRPAPSSRHTHRSHEHAGVSTTAATHPFVTSHFSPTSFEPGGQTHR